MRQKKLAVFDCETDPFKYGAEIKPFLIGYFDGDTYRSFREVVDFVEFIKTQEVLCYAHNGGKFDFLYLVPFMDPVSRIFLINERLGAFTLGKCDFRDSYLILPIPLKAYKKDEIDYEIFNKGIRDKPVNMQKIADYLENDCKYLYDLVKGFHEKFGRRMTLAATAMSQWQKISGRKAPNTSARFMEFWKQWYFGGRVQVFKPGIFHVKGENPREFLGDFQGPDPIQEIPSEIITLDINRAYSAAMKQAWFPYGSSVRKIDRLPEDEAELGRCFLEIDAEARGGYPEAPLKISNKERERLFEEQGIMLDTSLQFPEDGQRRKFKITGWEYLSAKRTGTLGDPKIISIFRFDDKINFSDFVDTFYRPDIPKDSTDYLFFKLVGNSLYGKFGQDSREFQEFFLVPQEDSIKEETRLGGTFQDFVGPWSLIGRPLAPEKQKFYNVAVSASITGWVRAYLWEAIRSSTEVFYADTDCIHCLGSKVRIGPALGEWKKEYQAVMGAYGGKKLYALRGTPDMKEPWKTASKGTRLTGPEIFRIANGEEIVYRQDAPTASLKGGFRYTERRVRKTI